MFTERLQKVKTYCRRQVVRLFVVLCKCEMKGESVVRMVWLSAWSRFFFFVISD